MLIVDDLHVHDFLSPHEDDDRSPNRWVSLLMPTHRSGPETTSDPIMLKNLLKAAGEQLDVAGRERLEETVAPLVSDSQFWQFQGDGLAVFVSTDAMHIHRLSIPLEPVARVADTPHLVPLAPVLGRPRDASILQLSLGQVRLFTVSGEIIEEAELGPIPASIDDLTSDRDHQTQLQFRSQVGGSIMFHGHGADGSVDRTRRDRFLRHVARGLEEREATQRTHGTLFLAATQETAHLFARISGRPELSDRLIPGSADGLRPAELLERAQPVLDDYAERTRAAQRDHLGQRLSQGRLVDKPAHVVEAAGQGRVETLYVGRVEDADVDLVNRAIIETLRHSGEVFAAPDGEVVAATLRF